MLLELQHLSVLDLLSLYAELLNELRKRGAIRSTNNPVADYAEYLCEKALSLTRAEKSTKGFDATDSSGSRFQIKGRRVTSHNKSRQLGVLRELDDRPFDYLAAVLFRENFVIWKACLVPLDQVRINSRFVERSNSWRFLLRDSVWDLPCVRDISDQVSQVQVQSYF